jgi:hypothetical protein
VGALPALLVFGIRGSGGKVRALDAPQASLPQLTPGSGVTVEEAVYSWSHRALASGVWVPGRRDRY